MSLLEAYLASVETQSTIPMLMISVTEHMSVIKEEAESLEHRCLTDEAFQLTVATLCVSVQQLKDQVTEAELGIERFVQNTFRKRRTSFELTQDLLKLHNAKSLDNLSRVPRMDRTSHFNVIKTGTQYLEIQHANKALVPPTVLKTPTLATASLPPVLEIFQTKESREHVLSKVSELSQRFSEAQDKMRIYQAHYERLGNIPTLVRECSALRLKMNEVATYIEQSELFESGMECEDGYKSLMRVHIEAVSECFDEMIEILGKEKANCTAYAFNTVNCFIECSATLNKLMAHLRDHGVLIENREPIEIEEDDVYEAATMYQREDTIS